LTKVHTQKMIDNCNDTLYAHREGLYYDRKYDLHILNEA
jgi:hypothetical protein